jgi:hypothetical protein
LWNAILFYTTGEIVKRIISSKESGAESMRSDPAERFGLVTRGWQNFQGVLERHWKPYLDALIRGRAGPEDFDRALAQVVSSL